MAYGKPITVIRYDDVNTALDHKRHLEAVGLSPKLINRVPHAHPEGMLPAGQQRAVELQVPPNQAARAVDALDRIIDDDEPAGDL